MIFFLPPSLGGLLLGYTSRSLLLFNLGILAWSSVWDDKRKVCEKSEFQNSIRVPCTSVNTQKQFTKLLTKLREHIQLFKKDLFLCEWIFYLNMCVCVCVCLVPKKDTESLGISYRQFLSHWVLGTESLLPL